MPARSYQFWSSTKGSAPRAIDEAKRSHADVLIIDTAGRLHVDEDMMHEVVAVHGKSGATETLFVVDAMTGQDAVNTAKEFNDQLNFDGVILTKLDGDTRGGAALSIRSVVNKPIKYVGTGEKMEALDVFHPSRMADRILANAPKAGGRRTGEGSILGGLGDLIDGD